MKRESLTACGVLMLAIVLPQLCFAAKTPTPQVREPAVAGLFYPKDAPELTRSIAESLSRSESVPGGDLKALIVPHAGYTYSGPVAAQAFRQLIGRTYSTVIVMGPSHYAQLNAAFISGARVFRTPLGDVPISDKAGALGKLEPFKINAPSRVERPNWWQESSRAAPPPDEEYADTWEHSVEVEVPFLQQTLTTFSIVPVVMGSVDPLRAARALEQILDEQTLLIASSDLSHYHAHTAARALDRASVDAILNLEPRKMASQEACGLVPILTLLEVAKQRGWTPRLLALRNSGDTAGDKSRVVGYTAIAFYASAPQVAEVGVATVASAHSRLYQEADRRFLLKLARDTVRAAATRARPPTVRQDQLSPELTKRKGCFITLNKHGALRGCIGNILPQAALYEGIIECARSAAVEDSRFSPVTPSEVEELEIEISVLTEPRPLTFHSPEDLLSQLQPHRDGVLLQMGDKVATYLPQVWAQLPDKIQFMTTLAEKAGAAPSDWRRPGTVVAVYQVESFCEAELRGRTP